MPFAITCHGPRVDWVDGEPGLGEGDDDQVLVGFDGDRRVFRGATAFRDQSEEVVETGGAGVDPCAGDDVSRFVGERYVVVDFGPINTAGDPHLRSFPC